MSDLDSDPTTNKPSLFRYSMKKSSSGLDF